MPASSEKQRRFMAMLAHNPKRRKEVGISQQDALEFSRKVVKRKKKSQK